MTEQVSSRIFMICTWSSWTKLIQRLWIRTSSNPLTRTARLCVRNLLICIWFVSKIDESNISVCFQVLLGSELIKSSSEERSLLKNLGSWLGKLTIGRNQVLRARAIDPKSLIIEVVVFPVLNCSRGKKIHPQFVFL